MKTIEFDATFGNHTKKVKLVPNAYGGDGYQVFIDNSFHGEIFYRNGMWQAHLKQKKHPYR